MTFLLDFFLASGMILTVCIVIWEIYIAARWVAEEIIEPAFGWINDILLRIYAFITTEEWLMWQEEDDDVQPPG